MSNETLTQAEAERAALAIAATQTAYALNNGGGIVAGQPLVYIDDQTTAGWQKCVEYLNGDWRIEA